jgi:hypothetical protein
MKAIATRYKLDSTLDTTGDDFIFIYVFFCTETHPEVYIPMMFTLDQLIDFISSEEQETGAYLKQIRTGLRGYGPKHSKVLEIITEEGFDLTPYIYQMVESKDDEEIEDHLEWCDRLRMPENQQSIKESVEGLDKSLDENMIKSHMTMNNFRDEMDQTLHELTLKYFPALFEMDQKNIEAYKDVLVRITLQFSEDIDKILHNIFSAYWEEQYNRRQKKTE